MTTRDRRTAVLAAAGVTLLALLTVAVCVRAPWLVSLDHTVADGLNRWVAPHPAMADAWTGVTNAGNPNVFRVLALLGAAALWWWRRVRDALVVVVSVAGAAALSDLVKPLVDRPRPRVAHPVVALPQGASYPSGHALSAAAALGAVVLVLGPGLAPPRRAALAAGAALLAVLIGVSRLCLGVHYLSDVLAGWLFGGLWLVAVAAVFRLRAPVLRPPDQHLGFRK